MWWKYHQWSLFPEPWCELGFIAERFDFVEGIEIRGLWRDLFHVRLGRCRRWLVDMTISWTGRKVIFKWHFGKTMRCLFLFGLNRFIQRYDTLFVFIFLGPIVRATMNSFYNIVDFQDHADGCWCKLDSAGTDKQRLDHVFFKNVGDDSLQLTREISFVPFWHWFQQLFLP